MSAHAQRRWLIAYDVAGDGHRRRLARLLEGQAQRVQRSVFSTTCTQHECVAILRSAERWVQAEDSLVAWPVVQRSSVAQPHKARRLMPRLPPYWIV